MSDDGLFSVITPVWNGARWLERAIGSVLDQTDRGFELIVVDDGSEDDSAAIAERIAAEDDRVRVIRLPNASGGPAHPRNVGLRAARGEFVAFLDQDDWWLPTKLEQQRAKFAEDDYALVYSDALLWRGEPGVFEEAWWGYLPSVRPHKVQPEGDVLVDLAAGNFIPTLTVAVRVPWVRRAGEFDEAAVGVDDWQYWLTVSLLGGRVGVIREHLAVYDDSPRPHLSSDHEFNIRRQREVVEKLAARFPDAAAVLATGIANQRTLLVVHHIDEVGDRRRPLRQRLRSLARVAALRPSPSQLTAAIRGLTPVGLRRRLGRVRRGLRRARR
jgi:teichuronic acid biosynthesis glycosyltransferase TuaG